MSRSANRAFPTEESTGLTVFEFFYAHALAGAMAGKQGDDKSSAIAFYAYQAAEEACARLDEMYKKERARRAEAQRAELQGLRP